MRTESISDHNKSWPGRAVKKWFNMKTTEFHPKPNTSSNRKKEVQQGRRKSCPEIDKDKGILVPVTDSLNSGHLKHQAPSNSTEGLRVFVGTWNIGGRIPHEGLDLNEWLISSTSSHADIYVLGFQEIVPLNARNIFGVEDQGPSQKWLSLIHNSLEGPTTPILKDQFDGMQRYCLAASKQMVGIFLCVWVRTTLMQYVSGINISCVGTGIMGYMGNKGSVSVSMSLQGMSFCFVCSHLASGERDGDQIRRNSDVAEILKRTSFSSSHGPKHATIPEHDKIIWLGDLNYRLAAAACRDDVLELLKKNEWQELLDRDQLQIEQRMGHVFTGWDEGRISFPPSYKYLFNSECYAIMYAKAGSKRRTPAWCDRILWRGKGMKQLCYLRDESQFSDHRPVYSLFEVETKNNDYNKFSTRIMPSTIVTDHNNGRVEDSSREDVYEEEMFMQPLKYAYKSRVSAF